MTDIPALIASLRATVCSPTMAGVLDSAADALERLQMWVNDLQSGMYINCVYCGHRYGPCETTPVSMADVLKAHIEQCPQHPMSALKAEVERLQGELREWQSGQRLFGR